MPLLYILLGVLFGMSLFWENRGLTKQKTHVLRSILPFFIIGFHLSYLDDLSIFNNIGNAVNSIFFSLSGYGLSRSLSLKSDSYWATFWKRRFFKILLPLILATMLYLLLFNKHVDFTDFGTKFLAGNTCFLPYTWFSIALLFLYGIFYLSFKYYKSYSLLFLVGLWCGYVMTMWGLGFESIWFYSSIGFVVGCIYENLESKWIFSNNVLYILLVIILIVSTLFIYYDFHGTYADMLFLLLFSILVIIIISRCNFDRLGESNIILFFSKISYEVYLIQGIVMTLFRGPYMYVEDDCLYVLIVYASVCLMATILHFVCDGIKYMFGYENPANR